MPSEATEESTAAQAGIAHRVAQRRANELKAATPDPKMDAQGLVEFACECTKSDCERFVKVPLYVYRRILDSGSQCLLQAGHHAFPQYRTIVTMGLMRIEERV
ncbi:MAG: hypothetical protein ACRDPZ_02080 [Gaiellaceae bacterium]